MPRQMNRRTFLRGAAGTAIALPFLDIMRPMRAVAADAAPKRFIAYCQPLGTFGEMFWPAPPGGATYGAFPDTETCEGGQKGRCRARVGRTGDTFLDNPDFELSRILQPLERHRQDLIVLENIDNAGGNHGGYSTMLTGTGYVNDGASYAKGISIDQRLAQVHGRDTKFASLQFGVRSPRDVGVRKTVSWYGEAQGAPPEANPFAMFQRVFGDVQTDPAEVNHLLEQRRSILDATLSQAQDLQTRLGREDRARVEEYLESVREVERRLEAVGSATCTAPEVPEDVGDLTRTPRKGLEKTPSITLAQIDMLAMAMACDLTRVATFQMAYEATNLVHTWLGVTNRWHDLSHNGASGAGWQQEMEEYVKISEWNAEMIALLIDKLKAFGVFEETALLWINPMNNAQIHNADCIPIVIAGSAGGRLRTGRHLRMPVGEHHVNDMHAALLSAMDLPDTSFGDAKYINRPLTELLV